MSINISYCLTVYVHPFCWGTPVYILHSYSLDWVYSNKSMHIYASGYHFIFTGTFTFGVLPISCKSLDLNMIKPIWDGFYYMMHYQIYWTEKSKTSRYPKLWNILQEIWYALPKAYFQMLLQSMPHWSHGGPSKYSDVLIYWHLSVYIFPFLCDNSYDIRN